MTFRSFSQTWMSKVKVDNCIYYGGIFGEVAPGNVTQRLKVYGMYTFPHVRHAVCLIVDDDM